MPATLAHLGAQALVTRAFVRGAPLLWIYLGCVLPDLPWILQRAIRALVPGIDPAMLRLYVASQASLLGCLALAVAVAAIARAPRRVFALLASGALLHLLLDAVEVKWPNGVLLLAPFDWTPLQLGWVLPESVAGLAWTLFGAVWVAWYWRQAAAEDPGISRQRRRWLAALALAALWLALPLAMMRSAWRADAHFVRTLGEVEERPGRAVELYRAHAYDRPDGDVVETLEDEVLRLEGLEILGRQRVSIRGRFVDRETIRVEEALVHPGGWRDGASYAGLAAVALLWGRGGWRAWRRRGGAEGE
ncbi:MAG TPA: hypothetical protein VMV46_22675 [Thermoanaerobaculia bacterium]|nr:hypothetical protein [Thermoanaerobaculia bacterium]